nr:MAG TPA: hydrogenase expression/formation protein [Caudoviricetes sp.]
MVLHRKRLIEIGKTIMENLCGTHTILITV